MELDKHLFNRTLSEMGMNEKGSTFETITFSHQDNILKIPYYINEHGYRSQPFSKDNEVLVLGCSQTYGSGMLNSFTWPDIFCNTTNKKYSSIAQRGDSINGQVYKAFKYFEEIGNPKILLASFPMYRLEYPIIPNKFLSPRGVITKKFLESMPRSIAVSYFRDKDVLEFSKKPHDPAYVIPVEFTLFYSFMFIKMLEQYCDSHNIKFIWNIHDIDNEMYYAIKEKSEDTFKNYLYPLKSASDCVYVYKKNKEYDVDIQHSKLHKNCFEELRDHPLFHHAADYDKKNNKSHWGIHVHKHTAEKFIAKYKEIEND